MRSKHFIHISFHHFLATDVLISAAFLGVRGLCSVSNVPSFLLEWRFLRAAPFEIPHCLTQIAEVLNCFRTRMQLE